MIFSLNTLNVYVLKCMKTYVWSGCVAEKLYFVELIYFFCLDLCSTFNKTLFFFIFARCRAEALE